MDTWEPHSVPLSFGFVPSLGEVEPTCGATLDQILLKLSDPLHGATGIHTLTLDFQAENVSIWQFFFFRISVITSFLYLLMWS